MVSVRWIGTAGLEFNVQGKTWLIDPYLSRIGKAAIFFGHAQPVKERISRYLDTLPGKLQGIIIGHTHFDHALDVPEIVKRVPVPLVGSESLETLMALHDMPGRVTVCKEKTRVPLPGDAVVTMIPSPHGRVILGYIPSTGDIKPGRSLPLKAADYRHGQVFNIKLEIGGISFMHFGSADLIDGELVGETCDVLFLCVPGWKKTKDYHRRVLFRVKPRIVVPIHFDDFSLPFPSVGKGPPLPFLSMKRFLRRISEESPTSRFILPSLYENMDF